MASRGYKLVVLGGGSAGLTMTNVLARALGGHNVALVEPSTKHYYQPLWTLVGAGHKNMGDSHRPLKSLIGDSHVSWIQQRATHIDPDNRLISLNNGDKVSYEHLILALGCSVDFSKIAGLVDALENAPNVCSNYHPEYVMKTRPAIDRTPNGRAIFTHPNTPIKCAGASQKIMYLAEDIWSQTAIHRDQIDVTFATANPGIFGVKKYADALTGIVKERNISTLFNHNLVSVDYQNNTATFNHQSQEVSLEYSMLHVTPPMSAPEVISSNAKLAAESGYLNTDPHTLRHKDYPDIWGIGDNINIPSSKTCAAVAAQAGVLGRNFKLSLEGGNPVFDRYDGYTSCPLVTGKNKGILAEFDSAGEPLETFPYPRQDAESWVWYTLKATFMPPLYWNLLLKGLWKGPGAFRKFLNPGAGK
jgi:NADH dehydrogenase FAD-containing subunit